VELSGGFEAVFFALVRPHPSSLSSYAFILGVDASNRDFEAHRWFGNGATAPLLPRVVFGFP
jgi:hypothetical protein